MRFFLKKISSKWQKSISNNVSDPSNPQYCSLQFFLNLGVVKFHRHTNSVCWKKCGSVVLFKSDESKKRLIFHLNTKIKVEEANEKEKLYIKRLSRNLMSPKKQVYEILKKMSQLKNLKLFGKSTVYVNCIKCLCWLVIWLHS